MADGGRDESWLAKSMRQGEWPRERPLAQGDRTPVTIQPSWMSKDGGDARRNAPRLRGLSGAPPESTSITPRKAARSSDPRLYRPQDVLDTSGAYIAAHDVVKLPALDSTHRGGPFAGTFNRPKTLPRRAIGSGVSSIANQTGTPRTPPPVALEMFWATNSSRK